MKKAFFRPRLPVIGPAALAVLAAFWAGREWTSFGKGPRPEAAAWANIGGCGSSGGGAAAGAGKWIGRGVTGGLVDLEMLSNSTIGGDYLYWSLANSFTFHMPSHPNWTSGLSLALRSNSANYEGYKVSEDISTPAPVPTGGFGDLGLSLNRLFGNENEHSVGISASLPTGQHDIQRLHFKGQNIEKDDYRYASPFLQPGSGLYTLGASYEYTKTKDWGLLVFGGSYTSNWAWDNWGCRDGDAVAGASANQKLLSCQAARPSALTWKLWELQHQPYGDQGDVDWLHSYGAPGTGATGADGFSFYGYVGHKEEASTQNVGLTLTVPLAPTYYWDYGPGTNDNRVSTRNRVNDYTLKFSAGLEISNPAFPIFLSVGLPYVLNDILERGRLVNPQNYIATVGIKGTFF
jgi:hypothetical protein